MLRPLILVFTLLLTVCVCQASTGPRLLVLGDSLSAAYGLPTEEGWVALLAQHLEQSGSNYQVVNASISGETTQGGLVRLPPLITRHQPSLVIIELGANDGLRGFPLPVMNDNLRQMIALSQDSGAEVLLIGMRIPPNYGSKYTAMFHNSFRDLASESQVPLVPFLLEGVAAVEGMIQADGLHPTSEAQSRILDNVLQTLLPMLDDNIKQPANP